MRRLSHLRCARALSLSISLSHTHTLCAAVCVCVWGARALFFFFGVCMYLRALHCVRLQVRVERRPPFARQLAGPDSESQERPAPARWTPTRKSANRQRRLPTSNRRAGPEVLGERDPSSYRGIRRTHGVHADSEVADSECSPEVLGVSRKESPPDSRSAPISRGSVGDRDPPSTRDEQRRAGDGVSVEI